MPFQVFAKSDVGLRSNNEDSYWALEYQVQGTAVRGVIIAVCDGMGGLSGGEIASSETIRSIREVVVSRQDLSTSAIIGAIQGANSRLLDLGKKKLEEYKAQNPEVKVSTMRLMLGTTCTLAILEGGKYRVFHVGDSRCYHVLADGSYSSLTTDHTAFEKHKHSIVKTGSDFILNGRVYPAKAIAKLASSLTNSVGTAEAVQVDVIEGTYAKGDMFLISSDGFWHELVSTKGTVHKEWVGLLRGNTEKALSDLMELFKAKGERDNLTATVVKVV